MLRMERIPAAQPFILDTVWTRLMPSKRDITELLTDWRNGDSAAFDELAPLVYDELRRLAGSYMRREGPGHTLQSTALVNEAYLRLVDQRNVGSNRSQFFGIAAQMMRRILVNHAKASHAAKRGGFAEKITFSESMDVFQQPDVDLLALDNALNRLSEFDKQQSRIVELRFFAGLTTEEVAEVLGISARTVNREWAMAKAWLFRELSLK